MKIDYIELFDQLALWLQNADSQTLLGGVFSLLGATVLLSMLVRYLRSRKTAAGETAEKDVASTPTSRDDGIAQLATQKGEKSGGSAVAGHVKSASAGAEVGGSLELILRQQRLIDSLAERVQALEGYLEMVSSRQQKSDTGKRDRLYYQDAIRAAKAGASAAELADQFDLPAAEANLIISLSGRQARAA